MVHLTETDRRLPPSPFMMAVHFGRSMVADALAERWPESVARHVQAIRLRRMIRHAYANVPFYREHMRRAGIRPEEIRTAEDLWRILPVDRTQLHEAGESVIDRRAVRRRLMYESTSGTSGPRLGLVGLPLDVAEMGGYMSSAWLAEGVRPDDTIVTVASRHLQWMPPPWTCKFLDRVHSLDVWMDVLLKVRPTVIIGQTEGILVLANEVVRRKLASRMRVRKVFTFGWTLPVEFRSVIREGFGVSPHDCYGTMETVWVGRECDRHEGFHVPFHRLVVQVAHPGDPTRPAPRGQPGALLLTDLCRTTMPFIRYRIGDVGEVTELPCGCGRPGPRVVNLVGRMMDILVTTDGRPMGFGWLLLYQRQIGGFLRDFRFIQESRTEVTLQWSPGPCWTPEVMEEIRARIRQVLGPVNIKEERYETLPPDPGAKMRRVIRKFDIPEESLLNLRLPPP